jgi:hypothetical protein
MVFSYVALLRIEAVYDATRLEVNVLESLDIGAK